MLKTNRLSSKILALGYSSLISWGFFHSALKVSRYQDFSCCSQSGWTSQKSLNTFLAITLKFFYKDTIYFPIWEIYPSLDSFVWISVWIGIFRIWWILWFSNSFVLIRILRILGFLLNLGFLESTLIPYRSETGRY